MANEPRRKHDIVRGELETITHRIRAAVDDCGINLAQLAEASGISRTLLNHYTRGLAAPTALNLARLCSALMVSSDYILGLSDVPLRKQEEAPRGETWQQQWERQGQCAQGHKS